MRVGVHVCVSVLHINHFSDVKHTTEFSYTHIRIPVSGSVKNMRITMIKHSPVLQSTRTFLKYKEASDSIH